MNENDLYYESIPIGRENAISREELARRWRMSEDAVRHKIAELRADDNGDKYIIFSSSDPSSRGYFKTAEMAEIRAFVAETINRANNTKKPLTKANRIIRRHEEQAQYGAGLLG